jgi:hypothetical protein
LNAECHGHFQLEPSADSSRHKGLNTNNAA